MKDNSKVTFSFFSLFPSARCQDLRRKKVVGTYLPGVGRDEETDSCTRAMSRSSMEEDRQDIAARVTICQGKVE